MHDYVDDDDLNNMSKKVIIALYNITLLYFLNPNERLSCEYHLLCRVVVTQAGLCERFNFSKGFLEQNIILGCRCAFNATGEESIQKKIGNTDVVVVVKKNDDDDFTFQGK